MLALRVLYEAHALRASSPRATAAALPGFRQLPSPSAPSGGNRFPLLLPGAAFPTLLIQSGQRFVNSSFLTLLSIILCEGATYFLMGP